jgi:hypothetical protein
VGQKYYADMGRIKARTANSTYKKLAVQWLNEALCPPVADSVVADSFVLPCLPVGREIANFL